MNQKNEKGRPLSDTQKLMKEHLEDKNHQITEEDMQKIEIGKTSPEAIKTGAGADVKAKVDQGDFVKENSSEEIGGANRITPWDVTD